MAFAEVAVDAPAGYDRTFSYSVPQPLSVAPGHLVRVPFGSRRLQGVVFSLAAVPQVPETRDILDLAFPEPVVTDTHLRLARWISRYYMCPLFDAVAPLLPPGGRVRPLTYLSADPDTSETADAPLTSPQRRVLEYVQARGAVEQQRLLRALGPWARTPISRLVDRGIVNRSTRRGRPAVRHKYRPHASLTPDGRDVAPDTLFYGRHPAPRQAALLERLMEDAPLPMADARREYGLSAVKALLAKGWVQEESIAVERDPLAGKLFPVVPPVALTPRQETIALEIRAALGDASPVARTFLVRGVTGSGKTEIYLDAAGACLELGRKVIVLVPEIALTHQTVERFASRFPGQVAVLHSGLSLGEQFDQWWKVKRGEYGVVIGSRGAIFAPQPDLGLIVIDEEHEWTYKQHDASPRYHARDVGLKLAEMSGATVVLGSATPDLGSHYRAVRKEFRLLTLPERFPANGNRPSGAGKHHSLATVEVVDMRRELREGVRDIFSRALVSAMDECMDAGRQMILFLNRRGSASYVQCRSCGLGVRCRRCDISLTYHRLADRLVCHYCGYRRIPPAKCSRCLSYRMSYYGVGTEAVVEEVSLRFPGAEVLRLDSDATGRARASEELLARFASGEAQVLVGTQMVAKGLHFPSVSLVGVVSADVGLNIPDYRAEERTFQLLCQVAGRAGRGPVSGRVVVQTYQPDNYAVRSAASQDYDMFYRQEMAYRREQANPPFSKLARLVYSHTNRAFSERGAARLAGVIRELRDALGSSDVEVVGPTPAYPPRLRGHYRWNLTLRGPEPRALLEQVPIPAGWVVDIDPVAVS